MLSRTRDDAAGEAYDKVAKLLGLGYPGGPAVDRLARLGNDRAIALPTTRLTHADRNAPALKGDLDFSFSGLKTAVLRHVTRERGSGPALSGAEIADICASFQRVVVTALIDRLFTAINEPPVLFSPPATVTLVVAPFTNPALVKLLALIVVVVVDASDAFAALVRFGADTYNVPPESTWLAL